MLHRQRLQLEKHHSRVRGLVFRNEDGSPVTPNAVSLRFPHLVRAAKLPSLRVHDLRHTHATLLLASGANAKTVSARLGHSSTSFTLDVYAASGSRRWRSRPRRSWPTSCSAMASAVNLAKVRPQRRTCDGETTQAKCGPKAACAIG